MRKIWVLVISVLFFVACEEIIEWSPEGTVEDRLVVEAILTDKYKNQEIFLSGLLDSLNGNASGVSDAFICVKNGSEEHVFWEAATEPGKYVSTNAFKIVPQQEYELTIDWQQNKYEANAQAVEPKPMRSFSFVQHQQTDSLYISGLGVEYSDSAEAMYEFLIDWSEVVPGEKTQAKLYHFVFTSLNIGQLFGPEKARFVFPRGSTIIVKKYNLDPQYAEYLRSLVVETQWKGGLFEESSGDLPTNLTNGALGYFAVCTVESDTLVAE